MSTPVKLESSQPHSLPIIESITPAKAEHYLKTMVANRPLSQSKVIEFALAIDEARWSLNGETIKFDAQGQLFDGQHRLHGCILAQKAFRSYVIRGITDPNAFSTVDTGKTRTHADIFGIAGWQNNKVASTAAMLILLYEKGRVNWGGAVSRVQRKKGSSVLDRVKSMPAGTAYASRDELVAFAASVSDELQQAVRFANSSKAARAMPAGTVAALYYLFRQKAPFEADAFFNDLGDGVGLQKSDPVWVLREKLLHSKSSKSKLTRWAIFGFAIKTWNKRRAGESASVMRVQDGEAFPKVK